MKYELPKEKCHKCKKNEAKGWIETKPVCAFCFDEMKKPRRIKDRELLLKRRMARGIVC